MRYVRTLLIVWLVFGVCLASQVQASAVSRATQWLTSNQDASGLWSTQNGTDTRDAASAIVALSAVGADSSGVGRAMRALEDYSLASNDYCARRIMATVASNNGFETAGPVCGLIASRNPDGGWGYASGYPSNVLDSALALEALKAGGALDSAAIRSGVDYLVSTRQGNNGWGFSTGVNSSVFCTAHALLAVKGYCATAADSAAMRAGRLWLKGQIHPDGGFGTGTTSNAYESALAILALSELPDSVVKAVTRAQIYLIPARRRAAVLLEPPRPSPPARELRSRFRARSAGCPTYATHAPYSNCLRGPQEGYRQRP